MTIIKARLSLSLSLLLWRCQKVREGKEEEKKFFTIAFDRTEARRRKKKDKLTFWPIRRLEERKKWFFVVVYFLKRSIKIRWVSMKKTGRLWRRLDYGLATLLVI